METKINGQEIPQLKMTSRSHYILFQFLTCLFRGLCFIPVKLWAKSDQFNLKKSECMQAGFFTLSNLTFRLSKNVFAFVLSFSIRHFLVVKFFYFMFIFVSKTLMLPSIHEEV